MKVLKDEVRERIRGAARNEFEKSGYARASMRSIAMQARMTVGNIYLYFPGKEKLFEAIVGDTVRQIEDIVGMSSQDGDTIRHLVEALGSVFVHNRAEFLILMTRADGSAYQNYKQTLISLARQRMRGQLAPADGDALSAPLAVATVEGLMEIFRAYDGDEAKLAQSLNGFLNYMLGDLIARR